MAVSVLSGLRGKVSLPSPGETLSGTWEREPHRAIVVSTRLVLKEVRFRPSILTGYDFEAVLVLEEQPVGESGKEPESGSPQVTLSFPILGKEVNLLAGLTERVIRTSGRVPEQRVTYDQLQKDFSDLVYQYQNLMFELEEARHNSEENTRKALAYRNHLQAS